MKQQCLGVFARYWRPSEVKTRLASSIGPEKAAEVYRVCLGATIARHSGGSGQLVVAYTPDDHESQRAFNSQAFDGWHTEPQSGEDLGSRMEQFFRKRFDQGAESVVLLGSDSPNLPLERISEAFAALEESKVVLGPAEDGGYYLLGLARDIPPIFADVPWGTDAVWQTTIDRLSAAGHSYKVLDSWYDVDEIDELERLQADLPNQGETDPALAELARELERILAD